jgi:hypothetical protein
MEQGRQQELCENVYLGPVIRRKTRQVDGWVGLSTSVYLVILVVNL